MTISTLSIQQLELSVFLGWPEKERQHQQTIFMDADIWFSSPPLACQSDDLNDTICYSTLTQKLRTKLNNEKFQLIEHLGYSIHEYLKSQLPPAAKLFITITKFPDIEGLTGGVTFGYGDEQK